jgi:hypothetical protein
MIQKDKNSNYPLSRINNYIEDLKINFTDKEKAFLISIIYGIQFSDELMKEWINELEEETESLLNAKLHMKNILNLKVIDHKKPSNIINELDKMILENEASLRPFRKPGRRKYFLRNYIIFILFNLFRLKNVNKELAYLYTAEAIKISEGKITIRQVQRIIAQPHPSFDKIKELLIKSDMSTKYT